MIRTTFFIAAAALVVAGALWLAGRSGDVTLSGDGWQMGVPLPVFIFGVLIVAVIAALIYRFWRSVRRAPAATRAYVQRRDREKGYKALTQGMVAVAAGDAQEAARQAKRATSLLAEPPLTMLLSAQAAQLNGDENAANRYFTAMLDSDRFSRAPRASHAGSARRSRCPGSGVYPPRACAAAQDAVGPDHASRS